MGDDKGLFEASGVFFLVILVLICLYLAAAGLLGRVLKILFRVLRCHKIVVKREDKGGI